MSTKVICPFSKPIIANWCQCRYANLAERCSGKMSCQCAAKCLHSCQTLVELLKQKSRFVFAVSSHNEALTHAQMMKIRCGGLIGMQRVLSFGDDVPDVWKIIEQIESRYNNLADFPYSEIMPDIKVFKHRAKSR